MNKKTKEILRYIIIITIMYMAYDVADVAMELATQEKLTNAYGIVTTAVFGALAAVLKFMFETSVTGE